MSLVLTERTARAGPTYWSRILPCEAPPPQNVGDEFGPLHEAVCRFDPNGCTVRWPGWTATSHALLRTMAAPSSKEAM